MQKRPAVSSALRANALATQLMLVLVYVCALLIKLDIDLGVLLPAALVRHITGGQCYKEGAPVHCVSSGPRRCLQQHLGWFHP